jgi:hypothetical protein
MRRTALAAICLTAVATTGLTGCLPGENKADSGPATSTRSSTPSSASTHDAPKGPFAGLSGGEIAERAIEATTNASSLRMKGDIPDDGSGGTLRVDMALNKQGECVGTMSVGGQGEARLVHTGDTIYMKYDEAFLRAQSEGESKADTDAAVAMLAGKWTKMSAKGQDAQDIASFCDLDTVLGATEEGHSNATRGKTTTVDGTPAIVLHEKDGKDSYTLYVATEGEPYLLRVDSASAEDPGTLTLSDYGKSVPVRMPAGDVLDLDALGG